MATASTPPRNTVRRALLSRRGRALLAGGVVLGIGTAVTLAAWNDSEYASGTFSSGTFNLQSSTDGAVGEYTDNPVAEDAAPLDFSAPVDDLAPEDTVYASLWVRLAEGTTTPATLDLVSLETTDDEAGNAANLSYSVQAIDADATCDDATTGVVLGGAENLAPNPAIAGDTITLPIGAADQAGEATQLCFTITASESLVQGGVTTATWQLTATSN